MRRCVVHTVMGLATALFAATAPARADVIRADATGSDSVSTANFWGVNFQSGTGFIQSVTFDLSAQPAGFFDFDGSGSFLDATSPILGALVGLTPGDISFTTSSFVGGDPSHPRLLTFNFAPGSFGPSDSFRFGADTDFFVADPTPGGAIGTGGAVFSVSLQGGDSGSATFVTLSTDSSEAIVSTTAVAVPESSAIVLLGIGAAGLSCRLWRRKDRGKDRP